MKVRHQAAWTSTVITCWLTGCTGQGGADTTGAGQVEPITVSCAAGSGTDSMWTCPQGLSLDCHDLASATFSVKSPQGALCSPELSVVYSEPLTPGKHTLQLQDAQATTLCSSEVTIVQSAPARLVPKQIQLWPPNHKLHVGSSRVDLQACKLEYSIVSPK